VHEEGAFFYPYGICAGDDGHQRFHRSWSSFCKLIRIQSGSASSTLRNLYRSCSRFVLLGVLLQAFLVLETIVLVVDAQDAMKRIGQKPVESGSESRRFPLERLDGRSDLEIASAAADNRDDRLSFPHDRVEAFAPGPHRPCRWYSTLRCRRFQRSSLIARMMIVFNVRGNWSRRSPVVPAPVRTLNQNARWLLDGSRVTRECHVRFSERLGVKLPGGLSLHDTGRVKM
jgi:hypothetical protein